jgi:N-acetyl-gamma-glutamyl-phosphate reductase
MVAARLVAQHPDCVLAFATSDKWAEQPVGARLGIDSSLKFLPNRSALEVAADAVLLCTPVEASLELAPPLRARSMPVIDLSAAFRLRDPAAYPKWYGIEHSSPALLKDAHYGLPELVGAPSRNVLVANPGCYPTASLLALAPLLRARLVDPDGIVVDAKSGVSGAGRKSEEAYGFVELDRDLRAYQLHRHRHTPEIAQGLYARSVTFTPHLLPVSRGLFATGYARPRAGTTPTMVTECLRDFYAGAPFVQVVPPDEVRLREVCGTNRARVGAAANDEMVIAVGAIDNLVKGAAGQAIQNLNLMFELPETSGLEALQPHFP